MEAAQPVCRLAVLRGLDFVGTLSSRFVDVKLLIFDVLIFFIGRAEVGFDEKQVSNRGLHPSTPLSFTMLAILTDFGIRTCILSVSGFFSSSSIDLAWTPLRFAYLYHLYSPLSTE